MATARLVKYEGKDVSVPVPEYRYTAFDPSIRRFRLFALNPNADRSALIRGSIDHYDLDDHPAYTALSYEWGDPSIVSWIVVDSTLFPVTENLDHALRTLRFQGCPLIWIDALCINQVDESEKAQHIPIMTEIYHEAESVCAWIGREENDSDKVMEIVRAMHLSRKASVAEAPWLPDEDMINRNYFQIQAFFNRTYWRRVWIIQELSVASQIHILCGSRLVQWTGLELLILRLQSMLDVYNRHNKEKASFSRRWKRSSDSGLQESVALWMESPAFKHITKILLSRSKRFEGQSAGLLEHLYDTVQSKATVPPDKIFALLGLSFDGANFVKQPSYMCTEAELALEMTKSFVFARKSLDIIFVASSSHATPLGLPSWCPDYIHPGTTISSCKLCAYVTGHDERHRLGVERNRWQATGEGIVTRASIRLVQIGCLTTRGKRVCSIVSIGPSTDSVCPMELQDRLQMQEDQDMNATATAINEALILYATDYSTQVQRPRLLRYLFQFDNESRYKASQVRDLSRRMQHVLQWRSSNQDLLIGKTSLKKTARSITTSMMAPDTLNWPFLEHMAVSITDGIVAGMSGTDYRSSPARREERLIEPELVEALESLQDLISEDMRFVSTTGSFHVGWAHRNAQPGDEIFLLAGCSMPAVLRRCSPDTNRYNLVGHAFLNKLMDGSFWNSLNKSDLEEIQLL